MSAFEFLFSLFGLLLGFSIAEIAGGLSRAYDRRAERSIGWLAPGLAAVLVLDLLSFWYAGWWYRDILPLNMWVLIAAAMVGLIYYFAATQIFPREGSTTAPSDHVMAHRRPIAVSVILANLIMFMPVWILAGANNGWAPLIQPTLFISLAYFGLLAVVGFSPHQRWVAPAVAGALLALVTGFMLGG